MNLLHYKHILYKDLDDYLAKIIFDSIEVSEEIPVVNNLFYAFPNGKTEQDLSYFEKDIEKVPKEYLSKVKKGLDMLRTGTVYGSFGKTFNSNNKNTKGYSEIRDDQIRIIYKHLTDNNYLIMGVFTKKDDNAPRIYDNICNRPSNIILEESEVSLMVENRLKEYFNNMRKGNR